MKPETQVKITELLAVLDMPEDEHYQWCYEHIPELRNCRISLADMAFRLRDEVVASQGEMIWHKAEVIVCEYMGKATCWFTHYGQPAHWIIAALIAKEITE